MTDNEEKVKTSREIIMKCWLTGGFLLGGLSMLYMQVRIQGIMPVAKVVIAINIFYSAAWLWRTKDVVLFKRSKSSDTKTKS